MDIPISSGAKPGSRPQVKKRDKSSEQESRRRNVAREFSEAKCYATRPAYREENKRVPTKKDKDHEEK